MTHAGRLSQHFSEFEPTQFEILFSLASSDTFQENCNYTSKASWPSHCLPTEGHAEHNSKKKKRKIILNWCYSDSHTCLSNTDLIALPSWIRRYGNLLKFPSKGHGQLLLVAFFSSMVHKDNGHVMLLIYTPNLHLKDRGVTIASSIRIR